MEEKTYKTAEHAFEDYYFHLIQLGADRGNGTKFFKNISFYISDPFMREINTKWRKFSPEYAEHEWEWYNSQDRSPWLIGKAAQIWNHMGAKLNSNYGWQLHREGQFSKIVSLLADDPGTRRAVMSVYDGKEFSQYAQDTPCLLNLVFSITDNTLDMAVHFRSQDIVYGFCNDFYTLSKYMERVYRLLKHKAIPELKLGDIHWFVNDLHLYEKHYEMYLR